MIVFKHFFGIFDLLVELGGEFGGIRHIFFIFLFINSCFPFEGFLELLDVVVKLGFLGFQFFYGLILLFYLLLQGFTFFITFIVFHFLLLFINPLPKLICMGMNLS